MGHLLSFCVSKENRLYYIPTALQLKTIYESLFRSFYCKCLWFIVCMYSVFINPAAKTWLCLQYLRLYLLYFLWPLTNIRSDPSKKMLFQQMLSFRKIRTNLFLRVSWTSSKLCFMGKWSEMLRLPGARKLPYC